MQSFKKLQVWEKSHDLTLKIYGVTSHFPREEIYGLTSQIRRACASIPTNIAEGCGRESSADFARFLQIAMGSASETEYLILLAHDLKYLTIDQYAELMDTTIRVKKMLTALVKNVRMNSRPAPTTDNR
ncbi:four helix bundle protein [Candidatus Poribacteria bacterium]|nr:four helix bundle protein [Candidatus Poribacteria bacterium]MYK93923.1 four helix bundle protein [Candidatus Poribacteria bacterium]